MRFPPVTASGSPDVPTTDLAGIMRSRTVRRTRRPRTTANMIIATQPAAAIHGASTARVSPTVGNAFPALQMRRTRASVPATFAAATRPARIARGPCHKHRLPGGRHGDHSQPRRARARHPALQERAEQPRATRRGRQRWARGASEHEVQGVRGAQPRYRDHKEDRQRHVMRHGDQVCGPRREHHQHQSATRQQKWAEQVTGDRHGTERRDSPAEDGDPPGPG
jgi:hypothetical protein